MDALERRGFFVYKIEDVPTHGGSIRVYAHKNLFYGGPYFVAPLRIMKPYPKWPHVTRRNPWFLWKHEGKRVVGYGAPAKASTYLNALHISTQHIACIMDSTPEKIGKFTPGSHIPIVAPNLAWLASSDIVVILAWNWKDEILPKIPAGPEVWCRGERLR